MTNSKGPAKRDTETKTKASLASNYATFIYNITTKANNEKRKTEGGREMNKATTKRFESEKNKSIKKLTDIKAAPDSSKIK